MIQILRTTTWLIHWGGIQGGLQGLEGQLTECRLGSLTFWVRENIVPLGGHFAISSNERMALKRGQVSARHAQVLDLCCPEEEWNRIAAEVGALDTKQRPIRQHRRFTAAWAREQFSRCKDDSLPT